MTFKSKYPQQDLHLLAPRKSTSIYYSVDTTSKPDPKSHEPEFGIFILPKLENGAYPIGSGFVTM